MSEHEMSDEMKKAVQDVQRAIVKRLHLRYEHDRRTLCEAALAADGWVTEPTQEAFRNGFKACWNLVVPCIPAPSRAREGADT